MNTTRRFEDLNPATIRGAERISIRKFLLTHKSYLRGKVIDFGCGKPGTCREPQPYRDLVEGEYIPIDKGDSWPNVYVDTILCTQVLQYVDDPRVWLRVFQWSLKVGGHLVCTYPTNWDEIESDDYWRFTKAGMERLLIEEGFNILHHERRAEVNLNGFRFPLGYGVVAQKI